MLIKKQCYYLTIPSINYSYNYLFSNLNLIAALIKK